MSVAKMRAFPLPIAYRPRKLFVEETETEDEASRRQRTDSSTVDTKRPRMQYDKCEFCGEDDVRWKHCTSNNHKGEHFCLFQTYRTVDVIHCKQCDQPECSSCMQYCYKCEVHLCTLCFVRGCPSRWHDTGKHVGAKGVIPNVK